MFGRKLDSGTEIIRNGLLIKQHWILEKLTLDSGLW